MDASFTVGVIIAAYILSGMWIGLSSKYSLVSSLKAIIKGDGVSLAQIVVGVLFLPGILLTDIIINTGVVGVKTVIHIISRLDSVHVLKRR